MSEKTLVKETAVKSNGISVLSLLGVVFVIFKLLGITAVAGWSWWLVTLPFWIGIAIVLAIILIPLLIIGAVALCVAINDKFFVK